MQNENKAREYDYIRPFHFGLAAVQLDGKWGFIDTDSNEVVSPQFYHVTDFQGDFARVRLKPIGRGEGQHASDFFYLDQRGTIISRDSMAAFHRQQFLEHFRTLPLISAEEVARIAPVIRSWTEFYDIDLSQARLVNEFIGCINCYGVLIQDDDFLSPDDITVAFSPDRQMYLNWIGGTLYYEGRHYHIGWDHGHSVWLYDLRQRRAVSVQWHGSSSLTEVALWKSNDVFILLGYIRGFGDSANKHTIRISDIGNAISTNYQIIANTSEFRYLPEVFFRERGIIADW